MAADTLSRHLARFASELAYEDLSRDQVAKIKTYFLDWIGSAYAGQTHAPIKIILDVVRSLGGRPEASTIPDSSKTMSLLAALVNGASSHMVEMDDLHRESIFHPAAAVMPAVFAVAERIHASGRELITAIAAGYEVGIRIAAASGPSHYHYWHTTGTCGTFGAAAGSAKILGLDEERTIWALGSAGTQAAGLWEFLIENAMSKQLHPGKAALNGVLASLLAQEGFTAAQGILEGEKGFFKATSQDVDLSKCLRGLGEEFMLERNSLKYHASCGHTHSAIDAVLQAIGTKPMKAHEIKEVNVYVYQQALDLLEKVEPKTPYMAKFSLPFCVATALIHGQVGLADFSASRLRNPEILRLMEKIRLYGDPELSWNYPSKWPARVRITTSGGKNLEGACDFPKGDPENPLMEQELIKKFKSLTDQFLSHSASEAIIEKAMNLESLPRVDMLFAV